jgi:hypothetical protein
MFGAFGISDRISQWPQNIRAAARSAIAAYKKARPVLQGNVYHLLPQPLLMTPPLSEPEQWEAIEYHDPGLDRAVVFCFRPFAREQQTSLRMRALNRARTYKVTFEDTGDTVTIRGRDEVSVRLPEQNRSQILWVERTGGA